MENYRKSKKDSGQNKINRRTQVKPEKFYKKYNLEFDIFNKPSGYDTGFLYRNITVCWYFKNQQTGERIIKFPGKWFGVSNYDKACACFEKYCRKRIKEIDTYWKLKEINQDFE